MFWLWTAVIPNNRQINNQCARDQQLIFSFSKLVGNFLLPKKWAFFRPAFRGHSVAKVHCR